MFCGKCGTKINDGDEYCTKCGTKVNKHNKEHSLEVNNCKLTNNNDNNRIDNVLSAFNAFFDELDREQNISNIKKNIDNLKIGDEIKLGEYFKNDNTKKEPIEWIVADVIGDKKLLVSKYILDIRKLDFDTWEGNDKLRKWLNNELINELFNDEEKEIIIESEVKSYDPWKEEGYTSYEKLFFPNESELYKIKNISEEFFYSEHSEYLKKKVVNNKMEYILDDGYWTRDAGRNACVRIIAKTISDDQRYDSYNGFRLAMYIDNNINNIKVCIDDMQTEIKNCKLVSDYPKDTMCNEMQSIKFGRYYQSNSTDKESIEWLVLEREEDKALLISKYVLFNQAICDQEIILKQCKSNVKTKLLQMKKYQKDLSDSKNIMLKNEFESRIDDEAYDEMQKILKKTNWVSCVLRRWLNGNFYDGAFIADEMKIINPIQHIELLKKDELHFIDKVFILNKEEHIKYFGNDLDSSDGKINKRAATSATEYAHQIALITSRDEGEWWNENVCGVWLRDISKEKALFVNEKGAISNFGDSIDVQYNGVRPAIWVKI